MSYSYINIFFAFYQDRQNSGKSITHSHRITYSNKTARTRGIKRGWVGQNIILILDALLAPQFLSPFWLRPLEKTFHIVGRNLQKRISIYERAHFVIDLSAGTVDNYRSFLNIILKKKKNEQLN